MVERRLNATAASLLGFLHREPMSGWDLAATAEHVIGDFWSLTRSQVYRELAWMADAGLIERGEQGPRERQPYSITKAGRAAFGEWVRQEPGPETIRFPLLLTMSFGRHVPPELLADFIARQREVHARRLAEYEAHAASNEEGRDVFRDATLAFGLAYERAVLAWFDSLPPLPASTSRPSQRRLARRGRSAFPSGLGGCSRARRR